MRKKICGILWVTEPIWMMSIVELLNKWVGFSDKVHITLCIGVVLVGVFADVFLAVFHIRDTRVV